MVAFTGVDGLGGQVTSTGAATLIDGTTVFTVSGGPIRVTDLISYCITVCDATAATLTWAADGTATNQASTAFTGASSALTSYAVGGLIYCNFTTISTGPVITATAGVALFGTTAATGGGIYVPAGIIKTTIASGPTTGTFQHFLRWIPLASGVSVTAAF